MTSPYLHRARLISIGGVLAAALVFAERLEATTIVYTFEGPQFTVGSSTPLLNVAPNVGDPTFRTDFTSAPTPDGLDIAASPTSAACSREERSRSRLQFHSPPRKSPVLVQAVEREDVEGSHYLPSTI